MLGSAVGGRGGMAMAGVGVGGEEDHQAEDEPDAEDCAGDVGGAHVFKLENADRAGGLGGGGGIDCALGGGEGALGEDDFFLLGRLVDLGDSLELLAGGLMLAIAL